MNRFFKTLMMNKIEVVAFDADDTLWVNEPLFQKAEKEFYSLLSNFLPQNIVSKRLLEVEIQNISKYGYGVKSFILSMIETAIEISDRSIEAIQIEKIINLGKEILNQPVEIIEDVPKVLESLYDRYTLILATKGDLIDQESKLKKSGLSNYFHHIEIMSEKDEAAYNKIIRQLDVNAENFLMIGNSLKSDIIPILNIGGHGFHVPYHTTWELEKVDAKIENDNFKQLNCISEVLNHLSLQWA